MFKEKEAINLGASVKGTGRIEEVRERHSIL